VDGVDEWMKALGISGRGAFEWTGDLKSFNNRRPCKNEWWVKVKRALESMHQRVREG
jgi:hypothetical protein